MNEMLRHNVIYTVFLTVLYYMPYTHVSFIATLWCRLVTHEASFYPYVIIQCRLYNATAVPLAAYQSVWLLFQRQLTYTINQRVCVLKCDIMETFRTGVISGNVKL
jgi:hypothetical protein